MKTISILSENKLSKEICPKIKDNQNVLQNLVTLQTNAYSVNRQKEFSASWKTYFEISLPFLQYRQIFFRLCKRGENPL
mgnify:CR=1 FL=1